MWVDGESVASGWVREVVGGRAVSVPGRSVVTLASASAASSSSVAAVGGWEALRWVGELGLPVWRRAGVVPGLASGDQVVFPGG
ncbi:hypothetical protein, partial [Micromonospora sp. DT4]|uniref:hypothetical protein n=1 Tax=Micromonospora sp. DT4 TaxID=3393438 RepID=UPI003CF77BE6